MYFIFYGHADLDKVVLTWDISLIIISLLFQNFEAYTESLLLLRRGSFFYIIIVHQRLFIPIVLIVGILYCNCKKIFISTMTEIVLQDSV